MSGRGPEAVLPLLLLLALPPSGCGAGTDARPSSEDSVYVRAMARLVFIQDRWGDGPPDTLRRADSLRRVVFQRLGVGPAALERYATRHGDDAAHMQAIWERIGELTDRFAVRAARGEDDPLELGSPGAEEEPSAADGPEGSRSAGDRGGAGG